MSSHQTSSKTKGILVPNHIAIIPDGNRRWARARGLHAFEGHQKGAKVAIDIARAARKMGVHTTTFWGFSTENWERAQEEVRGLMKLIEKMVDEYLKEALKEGVQIIHLGRKDRIPHSLLRKLENAEKKTAKNTKYILNLALDYGGHDEILRVVQKIINDHVSTDKVTKELFEKHLDTKGQPYPYVDLIIRTSGEQRTSGILPWQSIYAETYWERDHFPDFSAQKLWDAILDFSRRRRRFGGNDKVKKFEFEPKLAAKLEIAWWRLQNIPEGTKFRDYAIQHLKEQFGLSKSLTLEAAKYFAAALIQGNRGKWRLAVIKMKKFYKLIRDEFKLPFEPSLVATLEVKLWQETRGKEDIRLSREVEQTAQNLYAEIYRVSLFQAAKVAHLRILAMVERNLAEQGMGDHHWDRAEDYLEKFYSALRDRVA